METFSALLDVFAGNSLVTDAEIWDFLWSAPEPTVVQTMKTPVIWDAIVLIIAFL